VPPLAPNPGDAYVTCTLHNCFVDYESSCQLNVCLLQEKGFQGISRTV